MYLVALEKKKNRFVVASQHITRVDDLVKLDSLTKNVEEQLQTVYRGDGRKITANVLVEKINGEKLYYARLEDVGP